MDSFVNTNEISPSSEASLRPQDSQIAPYDVGTLAIIIRNTLGLPENGIGLVSCVATLVRDLKECANSGAPYPEWDDALRLLKIQLEASNTEAQDRIIAGNNISPQSKLLLSEFGNHLSKDSRSHIRKIRTKVILHHVCRRKAIPERLGTVFSQLISGKSLQLKELGSELTCDRKALSALRANHDPESDAAQFLTSLVAAIDTPISPPPSVTPQQAAQIIKTSHKAGPEINDKTDCGYPEYFDDADRESNDPKETTSRDVIGDLLWETEHARPSEFAGISNNWAFLQPQELESGGREFANDLDGEFGREALASLLAISTRTRPKEYRSIPLNDTASHSLWIDLESGHVVWKMDAVIDRQRWRKNRRALGSRESARIPLPVEVSSRLKTLLTANPSAANLAELFGGHLSSLDESTKRYLKIRSKGNHRLTLGRLSSSLGRYLLNICQDEAYASLLGLDFRIGTPSNFNYASLRAGRINSLLREAYSKLGLSGEITLPVSKDIGSRFLGAMIEIDKVLKDSLQDALTAFEKVKKKHDASSIAAAHTMISRSILRATSICSGHRESDRHSFASHTMDLEIGLALISDKAVSPYHLARLVPIPSIMVEWIRFYREWLAHIRYCYLNIDHHVSKYVDSILASINKRSDGPMFFSLSIDGEIRSLKNADISDLFVIRGLEANAGRHWAENILRESGLDSAVIMGWSGHSAIGQEAYGYRSALDPFTVCNAAVNAFNNHLDTLTLPRPPSLKSRRSHKQFEHCHDFIPGGFAQIQDTAIGCLLSLEKCPFDEITLVHSRNFAATCRDWLSSRIDSSGGDIAISLILNDGIINRDELLGATEQVIWGKIYADDGQYFVDSTTSGLGIRRAWLSQITVALTATLDSTKITAEALSADIDQHVAALLSRNGIEWIGSPLDRMIELARGFYSVRLPGVIRGWMFGDIHARTSRPETLARHRHNFVEHPSIESGANRNKAKADCSDKFITDLINSASDTTEYRGREVTRLKNLHDALVGLQNMALDSGPLEVKLCYATYLARTVESPASVARYYYPLRQFIEDSCASIERLEDVADIDWEVPVNQFRNYWVAASASENPPELTALNHFLRCFGIDLITLRRCDPAASARRYTDYPSREEVNRAVKRLPTISSLAPPRTFQATLALETMASRFLRWFEVSRLRVGDVAITEQASLVISHEAVGTHKSRNADRIHCSIDRDLALRLTSIASLRNQEFGADPDTFIFCNPTDSHSVSQSDELRRNISDALWSSTGSDCISPHCCRRLVPIGLFKEFLHPNSRTQKSPLPLRQFMYWLAGEIGHGDPLTTLAHYICDVDDSRRQWVSHLLDESKINPSPTFLASITGVPADTLRARVRRMSSLANCGLLDDCDLQSNLIFSERTRNLRELLVCDKTTLEINPKDAALDIALARAIYVATLLLGMDVELATFVSQIDETSRTRIDRGWSFLSAGAGKNWHAEIPIFPSSLRTHHVFVSLVHQLTDFRVNPNSALTISRTILQPSSAWMLFSQDDASLISRVLHQLDDRLITCVISRPNKQCDAHRIFAIFPNGRNLHRKLDSRWFPRGGYVRIQFVPSGTKLAALPAVTPLTTFLISAIFLTKCAETLGEIDG